MSKPGQWPRNCHLVLWRRYPDDPGGRELDRSGSLEDLVARFHRVRRRALSEYGGEGWLVIADGDGGERWTQSVRDAFSLPEGEVATCASR